MLERSDLNELIDHYAHHLVERVGTIAAFQRLCVRLADNIHFVAERDKIERAKIHVEAALETGRRMTQRESVQESIKLLISTRGDHELGSRCYELISRGHGRAWTAAQRASF